MSFTACLIVMIGGALGTLARYGVSVLAAPYSRDLPWGTIVINITGSFVIGLFGTLTLATGRFPVSDNLRLFVMIGLCGGYTTFSSFALQTLILAQGGSFLGAAMNILASVALCLLAVWIGHVFALQINALRGAS